MGRLPLSRVKNTINDFWNSVSKTESCWLWKGTGVSNGYGRFCLASKFWLVHRLSWVLHNGDIPEGLNVCHKCDIRNCVNPTHLFLGTDADNMQDMFKKGRNHIRLGDLNPVAKLKWYDVDTIRYEWDSGKSNQIQLARTYNMSQSTISDIVNKVTWKLRAAREVGEM